jgi:hypothetical protein
MTDAELLDRAERARRALDDAAFKDAVSDAKARLVKAWMDSEEADLDAREIAYWKLKALDLVVSEMTSAVNTGAKVASNITTLKRRPPV